ncbi:MAG: hypothetical protein M3P93_17745 [Actinomycetota bacterium]|nr:hypothetical protein [Actinomycetota bacterium]
MLLVPVVLVASLLVGAAGAVEGLRGRAPGRPLLQALLALQLLLMAQAALAVTALLRGGRAAEPVTFVGYLVLSLLLLPGALGLSAQERSRYGSLVLAAACLVVAVVELRLQATL